MKKSGIKLMAILCVVCLLLMGCSTSGDKGTADGGSSDETQAKKGDIRICYLAQANNTFQASLRDAAETKAKELGAKIDVFNGDNDITTQLDQIESAVANNYDAIILCAVDTKGVASGVQMIKDAKIPLVCVNMLIEDEELYDVYVGSDDVEAGKIQGDWLKKATDGKCNIGILYVPIGCSAEVGRTKGFEESFLDASPDAKVLVEADGQAQIDEGMRYVEDWLQTYPDLDVIVAQNDSMGLGAMQAVVAAGKKDDILICGVDGDQDAIQAIVDGTYDMSVFQNAEGQGSKSVEVACGLVNGETFEKSVMIPFEPITVDNAKDYQ